MRSEMGDIKKIQTKSLEMKNTISEMEKYTGWENNILNTEQEKVSTLGDIVTETIQNETETAKTGRKKRVSGS